MSYDAGRNDGFTATAMLLVVTAAVAFVAFRLLAALDYQVVFDDVFTLTLVEHGWGDLLAAVATHDYHPPLFYFLLKLWIQIGGTSLVWLGLLPAAIAAAVVVPLILLCRECGLSPRAAALAVALMAPNGLLLGFSQELRMYSLLLLLGTISMWLFTRMLNGDVRRSTLVALTLVNVLLVYTQYFAWLLIASQGLVALGWRRVLRRFSLSTVTVLIAFVPWAMAVVDATAARVASGQEALYFIARPGVFDLASLVAAFAGELPVRNATTLNLLLFGLPVMLWIVHASVGSHGRSRLVPWQLAILAFVPLAVAFVASHLLSQSVWGRRHLIFVAVPYVLLVAGGVDRLSAGWRRTATVTMVLWAAAAGVSTYTRPYNTPAWDVVAQRAHAGTAVTQVYAVDEHAGWLLSFHAQRQGLANVSVSVIKPDTELNRRIFAAADASRPLWATRLPVALASDALQFPAEPFWLAHRASRKGIKDCLERAGYTVGPGVTATSYTRRQTEEIALYPVTRRGTIVATRCDARAESEEANARR